VAQTTDDMMPWVAPDDLARAIGMSRKSRRALLTANQAQPSVAKRIRTADGTSVEVLAFQGVQGLMDAMMEIHQVTPDVHVAYVKEVMIAAEGASPALCDRRQQRQAPRQFVDDGAAAWHRASGYLGPN
jgi:hypothetical protein